MSENKNYVAIHEQIGSLDINNEREKLYVAELEKLPEIYFPSKGIDESALFTYKDKVLSKEELYEAMEKEREHYMPFFENYAPKMETTRTRKDITSFDWRVGTKEDKAEFRKVLDGEGQWETVQIPHFGEPLGLATTYYRTEFELSAEEMQKDSLWVCFKAVDYRAFVYINGALVGSHEGIFAPFEFDFTTQAKEGKNTLLVVVENDFIPMGSNSGYRETKYTGDKIYAQTGVGYDEPLMGWHHCPAGMGIWQDVSIEGRSDIFIHDIFVRPTETDKAEVWVELFATKVGLRDVTLDISIFGQNFRHTVFEHMKYIPNTVTDGYTHMLKIERGLNYLKIPVEIPDAKIWETTEPWLYQAQIRLYDEKENLLDTGYRQFGMRFFSMDTDCNPKGRFYLNGKRIKFRGVNSQGREQRQAFLKNFDELLDDYLLAKVGNINYLRITQRPVQSEVYDMCDKLGLLVQTDFPAFGSMRRNTITEAIRQAQEMEHLIRSHPCCVVSTYINEPFPNGQNKPHRCMQRHELEMFFSCADMMIHVMNPDRVIKPIDGDYDPPVHYGLPDYHCYTCWYNGHLIDFGKMYKGYWIPVKEGWNYGCGEFGMEGLDPVSLMKKYYPKEWLPENDEDAWTPATIPGDPPPQLGHLHYQFYETPKTMAEWTEASQEYQAEVMNFTTRAYRRNRKMISYAYHLFIDAYPNGWMKAMIDYERTPKKAFWEFRESAAPIMVDLRTDRFRVWSGDNIKLEARVCNDIDEEIKNANLCYQVYMGDKLIQAAKRNVDVAASDVTFAGFIDIDVPETLERTDLKIQLAMIDDNGTNISNYEYKLHVFPKEGGNLGKITFVGNCESFINQVKANFDCEIVDVADADNETSILVFDSEKYLAAEKEIIKLAENGAKVILFTLPEGEIEVADTKVNVIKCPSRPVHFISRDTNHPIVADFGPKDVRHFYNEKEDLITPVIGQTFDAEGFTAILTGAKRGPRTYEEPQGKWEKSFAVAEKKVGEGYIRICQIDMQDRITKNPVAHIIFKRLITM